MIARGEMPIQRARLYWVHVAGPADDRRKVTAYDAADAAAQIKIAHPEIAVLAVKPLNGVKPEQEWGGSSDIGAILGVSAATARDYIAQLEAEHGLGPIRRRAENSNGARYHLPTVRRLLLEMSEGSS